MSHLLTTIIIIVLTFGGLLFTQRQMRFEIQGILLILTKNRELTNTLFALIFLPGVFLHETSHYVTAKLLGVKTGRFSVIPKPLPSGNIRLGYVEIEATDFLRESLIGVAPFLTGLAVLTCIVFYQLNLSTIINEDFSKITSLSAYVGNFLSQPDLWIWLYFGLTISNMMFPSEADRKAWFPVILIGIILVVIGLFLGVGAWFWGRFGLRVTQFLDFFEVLFGFALLINFVPLVILWPIRVFLSWITHSSIVRT